MTEERALMPFSLEDTLSLGEVLTQSGYFKDTKDASQAVVKVLAGREMGFGPIASMQGIHIIQGQPSIGANLLGAAVKRTHKYNYRVAELTDERAEIAFFEDGREVGRSIFTMEDAKRAGLNGKGSWKTYPRNMLFARAMSNGARWYCPDVFGGVTPYTPEELGAEVNESGDVIDVTPTPVEQETTPPEAPPPPPQQKAPSGNGRKSATVSTKRWAKAAAAVAQDHPHYTNQGGDINFYHMTNAAAKLGYPEITDENLAEVCQALRDHAAEKMQEELPL